MSQQLKSALIAAGTAAMLVAGTASADGARYEVTITNLTRGTLLTPVLVVSHAPGVHMFAVGEAASEELAQLAEGGATQPLQDALMATGKVHDAATTGPIPAGESVTVELGATHNARYLSLASMMLPTNDGFIALNGVNVSGWGKTQVFHSPGYDAGSELNDEACVNIPGPHCGGEGYNAAGGEGYVHIHAGLHGIGDLIAADHDWRNPVAEISVKRVRN
ncbi:MAG: hypothetical protein AMJ69_03725 [Gammaproteobacteria bacterium SG8_47]|nr:MAG: hypothetical protein AMJ69_03725 [Gammaproteobacteria bacterium SG8_47]